MEKKNDNFFCNRKNLFFFCHYAHILAKMIFFFSKQGSVSYLDITMKTNELFVRKTANRQTGRTDKNETIAPPEVQRIIKKCFISINIMKQFFFKDFQEKAIFFSIFFFFFFLNLLRKFCGKNF